MCFVLLLCACASPPPVAEAPSQLNAQRLVLDVATGEHLLLDADSRRAQELATGHPGRLVRVTAPATGVVTLGNVSIPLALGASRAPAALQPVASLPEESLP